MANGADSEPKDLVFVVPTNDLEALAVADLVEQKGYPVLRRAAGWGDRVSLTAADLRDKPETVVLVELPHPATQTTVEATGRSVLHIDHHLYARPNDTPLDRRHPLSSLEQVARLIGAKLDDRENGIAANDRGYIPGLFQWANDLKKRASVRTSPPEQNDTTDLGDTSQRRDAPDRATRARHKRQALLWRIARARLTDLTVSRLGGAKGGIQSLADLGTPWFLEKRRETRLLLNEARAAVNAALTVVGDARILTNGARTSRQRQLALCRLPNRFAGVGMDAVMAAILLRKAPKAPYPNVLLLFHTEGQPETLTQVEYSGPGERSDHVAAWIEPDTLAAWKAQRLTVFGGASLESCYLVAKDEAGTERQALNAAADGLLNDLLIRNRPLEAWRTSFFQPIYLGSSEAAEDGTVAPVKHKVLDHLQTLRTKARARWEAEDEQNSETDAACPAPGLDMPHPVWVDPAERAYFLPHLRGILLDGDQQPDEAHRCSDGAWTDAVDAAQQGNRLVSFALPTRDLALVTKIRGYPDTVRLPIRELRAHFFFNDTCILEWTLEQSFAETGEGPFWMALLSATPTPGAIESLDQVIDVNAWLRFTSSTREGDNNGPCTSLSIGSDEKEPWTHGDTVSRFPLVGWFADLVEHALGLTNKGLKEALAMPPDVRFLADDRARVMTSVVVRGGIPRTAPARSAWDACLARLHMVDPADDGFEYDATFSRGELRRGGYWRFQNMGTLYAATDHSFAMLGHGWFPRHYIHDRHMRTMYRRMVVVTQFYGAILTAFSVRVSQALELSEAQRTVQERKAVLRRAYQNLHEDQLRFTNHFWFTTLSSQLQGKELFDLLRNQARIEDEYRLVSEEIERMSQFLAALDAEAEGRRDRTLARIGLPFVLFMAIMTLAIDREHHNFWLWPALERLFTPAGAWFGAGLVAALWSWAVVDWVLRPPEPGRRWWQALTRPSIALSIGSAVVLVMAGLLAPPLPTPCP